MPTNKIIIEYEVGKDIEVKVWDSMGNKHDVSDIFEQHRDVTTKSRETANLFLGSIQNHLSTNIQFQATKKELSYDVPPAVIEQILQMKEQ